MCLGQVEHLLTPGAEPDAEGATRPEGEERLNQLKPAPLRVAPRIEEARQPLPAVARSHRSEDRERRHQRSGQSEVHPTGAVGYEHDE